MNHQKLKEFVYELDTNLTADERTNETVAALGQAEGNLAENVATIEKLFTEKFGYKKEAENSPDKEQRHRDSDLIRQAIAKA